MNTLERGRVVAAIFLIGLGVVLFGLNFFPTLKAGITWPVIFFIFTAAFYLPPLIWPEARQGLAALFIPGSVMLVLGSIFSYNMFSGDWESWSYIWALIPAGVGFGLMLAAWIGQWGKSTMWAGLWIMLSSVTVFSILSALFGSVTLKSVGPVLLIFSGIMLIVQTLIKPFTNNHK